MQKLLFTDNLNLKNSNPWFTYPQVCNEVEATAKIFVFCWEVEVKSQKNLKTTILYKIVAYELMQEPIL